MASAGTIRPPITTVRGVIVLFHIIAFVTTFLRLLHRYQRRHLGWDDFWAGTALMFAITTFLLFLLRPIVLGTSARPLPSVNVPIPVQSFLALGTVVFYMAGLWTAKISMAATIVRLLGDGSLRKLAQCAVIVFLVVGLALSTQRIFRCGSDFSQPAFCTTPRYTGYVELVFDMVGDTWLIGAPLYILKKMRLARRDHRVIAAVFLCGLFTTIASILHDAFILAEEFSMVGFTAHIQVTISIVICNLPVLVTFVYRKINRDSEVEDSTESSDTDTSPQPNMNATPMTALTPPSRNHIATTGVPFEGPVEQMATSVLPSTNSEGRATRSTLDLGSILNSVRSTPTTSNSDYLSSRSDLETSRHGTQSVSTSTPTC
ncbi:hypothetical protein BJ165DRAFT_1071760 [Panaeolus papilionaceus]|nr:hypothetical protein BJ165DRAFT_1071760 [Panaeolus papilionaceus]